MAKLNDAQKVLFKAQSTVTTAEDARFLVLPNSEGVNVKITVSDFMNAIASHSFSPTLSFLNGGLNASSFDGIFIAVTRLSDTFTLAIRPANFSGDFVNDAKYHVDGILIVSGDKSYVVACEDTSLAYCAADMNQQNIPSSSSLYVGGDRTKAISQFAGSELTQAIVANQSAINNVSYAIGYCYQYTSATSAYDTSKTAYAMRKAGKWFLPSTGELFLLASVYNKFNTIASFVNSVKGSTVIKQLSSSWYWSSTEYISGGSWVLKLGDCSCSNSGKQFQYFVRPFAAF